MDIGYGKTLERITEFTQLKRKTVTQVIPQLVAQGNVHISGRNERVDITTKGSVHENSEN